MQPVPFHETALRRRVERFLLLLVVLTAMCLPAAHVRAAADLLPNLQMAPLADVRLDIAADGRHLLRFSAIIVNTGAGPFELYGSRASTAETDMGTVVQRVYDDQGGSRTIATPASMFFAGDGHQHWHVRNLEHYELRPLDAQHTLGVGAKSGFCFFDGVAPRTPIPGAPAAPHYLSCGDQSALSVTMGTSVGWGDIYDWTLPDQYIDVTGLPPGRYRLLATADDDNWFLEQNDGDNTTSLDVFLSDTAAFAWAANIFLPHVTTP